MPASLTEVHATTGVPKPPVHGPAPVRVMSEISLSKQTKQHPLDGGSTQTHVPSSPWKKSLSVAPVPGVQKFGGRCFKGFLSIGEFSYLQILLKPIPQIVSIPSIMKARGKKIWSGSRRVLLNAATVLSSKGICLLHHTKCADHRTVTSREKLLPCKLIN